MNDFLKVMILKKVCRCIGLCCFLMIQNEVMFATSVGVQNMTSITTKSKAIDMREAQEYDKVHQTSYISQILTDLEFITGVSYTVVDGFLQYTAPSASKLKGSQVARKIVTRAIDESATVAFSLNANEGSFGSGSQFKLDVVQIEAYIKGASGALNEKTMGFGMLFISELLRTTISLQLSQDTGSQLNSWGAVKGVSVTVNAIRSELGEDFGQRLSYTAYHDKEGVKYLPFDMESKMYFTSRITKIRNYTPVDPLFLNWKYISL